jgi:hypothetical protein
MATLQEQQLAKDKDIVVAWLNTCANISGSHPLREVDKTGGLIANGYKTIAQAISETSTAEAGTDATG